MGGAVYCSIFLLGTAIAIFPCGCPLYIGSIMRLFSYFVEVNMKILSESRVQSRARGGVPGYYLSSPPASLTNDNRAVFPTVADVNNDRVTVPANAQYVSYKNDNNEVISPIYVNNHGVVVTPTTDHVQENLTTVYPAMSVSHNQVPTFYPAVSVPRNQVPTAVEVECSNVVSKNNI
jgi:hypothetical protein